MLRRPTVISFPRKQLRVLYCTLSDSLFTPLLYLLYFDLVFVIWKLVRQQARLGNAQRRLDGRSKNAIALLGAASYSRFRRTFLISHPTRRQVIPLSVPRADAKARGDSQGDEGYTERKTHSQDLGRGGGVWGRGRPRKANGEATGEGGG